MHDEEPTPDADDEDGEDPEQADAVAGMYEQSDGSPVADSLRPEEGESEDGAKEDDGSGALDAPLLGGDDDEPETSTGTFYVKYAREDAVTLHEVNTAQICTLIQNPGIETHDIIEATLVAQPPMQVSYLIQDLEAHYSIPVETSPEPPTKQVRDVADDLPEGEAVAIEREGDGEIHILAVDPETTARTADELYDDEMIYKNAARYDAVERVEIRTDEEEGVVSIRYLP